MRKATLVATAIALCVCLTMFLKPGTVSAADTIKIGVILSTSGVAQPRGIEQRDALTALAEDVNGKGGVLGKKLELILVDDKSEPAAAAAAAEKLIKEDKVAAIIGATAIDATKAVFPVCDREKIAHILTTPAPLPFNKWAFPLGPGDQKMNARAFELAIATFDAKRVALLTEATDSGSYTLKVLGAEISQYPGTSFVAKESFGIKDNDVTAQLSKIKAANPDVIILLSSVATTSAAIARNYKQLGMKTPVVCIRAFGSPDFLKAVEELGWTFMVLRVMVAESMPPNDAYRRLVYGPVKKIMDDKKGAGVIITGSMGTAFDALNMVVLGLKGAGSDDRAALRDALEKVKFQGLIGGVAPTPEDHQGGAKDTSVLAVLKSGKFVPNVK